MLTQMYFGNPSMGLPTNKRSALTFISAGADFDLVNIAGITGGSLHFEQLWVPFTHNLAYGLQAGDVSVGKPPPYVPKVAHLTLFTYEQKLLDDRLSLEAGKSNAGNYFSSPLCNFPFSCINAILQDSAGISPAPYANWNGRAAYSFTPALRAQVGIWRSNNAYPFTNGWERGVGDSPGTMSTVYLANLSSNADFRTDPYPLRWEVLGYHNTAMQTNPYYTTRGTSQISDSDATARTHKGVSGFYLGARKAFWRQDSGVSGVAKPAALSGYATLTQTLDKDVTNGLERQVTLGVILSSPWQSRPDDSYSLSVRWDRFTDSEQRFQTEAYRAAGGTQNYYPKRNEYSINADANFVITDGVILSGYVTRTFNANAWMAPYTNSVPRDGVGFGLFFTLLIDDLLGLSTPNDKG
jgi:porin